MKNKSIGRLLLLVLLAPSCGGGGGGGGGKSSYVPPRWSETFRVPTSVDLRTVRFGNALSGIAAGKFGTFVRTDDGGDHWRTLEFTPSTLTGDILNLAVASTTTLAVGSNPGGGAQAWLSTDATVFRSPESLPSSFSEPWVDSSIIFPAGGNATAATVRLRPSGLIDAYQGTLLNTWDSRHNAQPAVPPPVPDTPWTKAYGMVALGPSAIWYVCGDNGGFGQIRKTINEGQDFATSTLPASTPILRRMSFVSLTQGFACGDDDTILFTTDGDTWTAMTKPAITTPGKLYGIGFFSSTLGFACGEGGRLYRLRFAASVWNWEVITQGTPSGVDLYDVSFGDLNTAFAVGDKGTVLKTSNASAGAGLNTWIVKSTAVPNPSLVFNAVDFTADGSTGLAVGTNGTVMRTLDGGQSWATFNSGLASQNITAVSIPRSGTGTVAFIGTSGGLLFYNPDLKGTGTWTAPAAQNFPGGAFIRAVLFPKGDGAGIATGDAGGFATLVFAGPATFTVTAQTLSPLPTGINYAAACDPSGNTLYLAGDGGYLVESTNGGTSWSAVSPAPPNVSIRALSAPNGGGFKFFAAASTGDIHRLPQGGVAWSPTAGAAIGTPVSMAFINDATGLVVTQDATKGGVYYTFSSGTLWTKSALHVPVDAGPHTLNAVWLHPSLAGVVVGGNDLIMKTTTAGQ